MLRQSLFRAAPALKTVTAPPALQAHARAYAKCTIVGRLGGDPVQRENATGGEYWTYRLAVAKPPKRDAQGQIARDADGNPVRDTDWFTVFNFKEGASDRMSNLHSGDLVLVEAIMTNKANAEGNAETVLREATCRVVAPNKRETAA